MDRILVVDDDASVRELLKNRLLANGYEVVMMDNGLDAISMMKNWRPDLIIMDVYMPSIDGLSLFQEIQSDEELKDIPILVISGVKSMRDIFQPSRIARFMTKPFDPKALLATVKECVSHG